MASSTAAMKAPFEQLTCSHRTMPLFDLPPELVLLVVTATVQARSFRRAMRLRLVSRRFQQYVDKAIIRLRLLDHQEFVANSCSSRSMLRRSGPCWPRYVHVYLARQALVERDPLSSLGRIRRAAEQLCRDAGEAGEDAMMACLQPLCGLACDGTSGRQLLRPSSSHTRCSEDELAVDLLVAAVHLDRMSTVKRLIADGLKVGIQRFGPRTESSILGHVLEAAMARGNLDMMRLLIASDTALDAKPLPMHVRSHILVGSARWGHSAAFNFALDGEAFDISRGERYLEYDDLRDAILLTPHPHDYQRGAAIFGPESAVFSESNKGSLLSRLANAAGRGHLEMVRFFLEQGANPNHDLARRNPARPRQYVRGVQKPLLDAILRRRPAVVKLLLENGANPNWYPPTETALMAAARKSCLSIATMLLDHGADVNEGQPPPIVMAVRNEDMSMFRLLRDRGAVLDTPETGPWAMAVARHCGLDSMIRMLVQEGVDEDLVLHRVEEVLEVYSRHYLFLQRE